MRWLDKKGENLRDYKDLNDNEVLYMVEENDEYAKEILFQKYRPLIEKYARKYLEHDRTCGLELDDYIQEGYYALFYAYKHYNIKCDNTFYTYLMLCIKSRMRNLHTTNSNLRHKSLNESISLYSKIVYDEETELIDLIADSKGISPVLEFERKQRHERLKETLYRLPFKQACVLELYYNGFQQKDISTLLDIKQKCIAQTISRIKKKLIENNDY